MSSAIDRATSRKGKREVRRAGRRVKRLDKAKDKLAGTKVSDPSGVAIGVARTLDGGKLGGPSRLASAIGASIAASNFERQLSDGQFRRDRVDTCREKLVESWNKIAKEAKPATHPIAALDPKPGDKKA